jgi:hypothetical protein
MSTAAPITAPIPGSSGSTGYLQSNLDANTAYKNALTRINQQRLGTLQQYGYQGDVNPTDGTIQNMRVDPTNPYGNLQSMLRTQAQQHQSDLYATEDRGLMGGLANQAQSADKYNDGAQSAALGQTLTSTLGGYTDQQNSAAYTRDAALAQAEQAAAEQAILAQAFTGADFSGLTYPDYGDTTTLPDSSPPPSANAQTTAQKMLIARGVAPKNSATVDPGILAAILSKPVPKKAPAPTVYVPGGSTVAQSKAIIAAAAAAKKKGAK